MLATQTIPETVQLPPDLRSRIRDSDLIRLALEAVQEAVDWKRTEVSPFGETIQAPVLITVIIYCYASGVFNSRAIEQMTRNDRSVRYLCAHHALEWETIRRFRRHNASLVVRCLAAVLEKATALMPVPTLTESPGGGSRIAVHNSTPHQAVYLDAQARVAFAIQSDSMEMDE